MALVSIKMFKWGEIDMYGSDAMLLRVPNIFMHRSCYVVAITAASVNVLLLACSSAVSAPLFL